MRAVTIITKEDVERFYKIFKERNTRIMNDCNAREEFELIGIYFDESLDKGAMEDIYSKVKTLGKSIKIELM